MQEALGRWKCFKTQKVMPFKIFIMEHLSKSGAAAAKGLGAVFHESLRQHICICALSIFLSVRAYFSLGGHDFVSLCLPLKQNLF